MNRSRNSPCLNIFERFQKIQYKKMEIVTFPILKRHQLKQFLCSLMTLRVTLVILTRKSHDYQYFVWPTASNFMLFSLNDILKVFMVLFTTLLHHYWYRTALP